MSIAAAAAKIGDDAASAVEQRVLGWCRSHEGASIAKKREAAKLIMEGFVQGYDDVASELAAPVVEGVRPNELYERYKLFKEIDETEGLSAAEKDALKRMTLDDGKVSERVVLSAYWNQGRPRRPRRRKFRHPPRCRTGLAVQAETGMRGSTQLNTV